LDFSKPLFSLVLSGPFLFIFFLGIPRQSLSQIQNEKFQGTVIDSATAQPIPQVNLWTNHSSTISNADGNFSLVVLDGDTIHFSHVSYHELAIKYDSKLPQPSLIISLHQKIRLLDEVKIYFYLSESEFRQKIMETTPVLTREEEIAQINSKIITYLARYAPAYPMNAHDNYIDYMKGPQGVVILSSKPSKGLIRAIKNVIKPNLPSYKRFLNSDSSMRSLRYR
jgi:hypothetical protein